MKSNCSTASGEELLAYIAVGKEAAALLTGFYMAKLRWGQGVITGLVTIQAPIASPNLHWTAPPPPPPHIGSHTGPTSPWPVPLHSRMNPAFNSITSNKSALVTKPILTPGYCGYISCSDTPRSPWDHHVMAGGWK